MIPDLEMIFLIIWMTLIYTGIGFITVCVLAQFMYDGDMPVKDLIESSEVVVASFIIIIFWAPLGALALVLCILAGLANVLAHLLISTVRLTLKITAHLFSSLFEEESERDSTTYADYCKNEISHIKNRNKNNKRRDDNEHHF